MFNIIQRLLKRFWFSPRARVYALSGWNAILVIGHGMKEAWPEPETLSTKKKLCFHRCPLFDQCFVFSGRIFKQIRWNHVLKWPIELMPRHIEHMVTYATRFYIQKSNVCILFSIFDNCETWKESERLLLRIIFRLIVFFPHGSHSWMYDSGEQKYNRQNTINFGIKLFGLLNLLYSTTTHKIEKKNNLTKSST